ncbi:type II secretion system protein [Virgisporangium ochraceum]|uniref:Type II secretion system protein n=1 Tax=Virgisporangium ochraceum TaxID=65505 RepID=A0A8J4EGN5_9ACTN|nr:type II secretion system protein [Virgisporangium ochraceum]
MPLLLGAGFGLGIAIIVAGLRRDSRPLWTGRGGRWLAAMRGLGPIRVAAGLVSAAVVWVATGWLVGGVLTCLAEWALPGLIIGAEQARQNRLRRVEGIATWVESLVATLGGAAGLEQAIITTAPTAPAPIRPQVTAMADALRVGARLPEVLRGFSSEVGDPFADTVAASLLLASTQGAGRLADPLTLLASAAREEVAAQRRVERGRAKAATDARLIIATTLAMAVGLVVFNRGYLRPYDTVTGQIVLAVVGVLFAIGFRWLSRLARPQELPRVLEVSVEAGRR